MVRALDKAGAMLTLSSALLAYIGIHHFKRYNSSGTHLSAIRPLDVTCHMGSHATSIPRARRRATILYIDQDQRATAKPQYHPTGR